MKEDEETFGSQVGEGCGCLLVCIGLAILLTADAIIDLVAKLIGK